MPDTNTQKPYTITINALDTSEVEIDGEISAATLTGFRTKALQKFNREAKIDGFRAGHIPEKVLVDRIGEPAILEEAAEMALSKHYPEMVREHELDVIGQPAIAITKIAKDNPLGFKVKTAVLPTFDLPDYQTIAADINKKKELVEVSDQDMDMVLKDIRKTRYYSEKKQAGEEIKLEEVKDEDLPELTDDFVKTLGDFNDVAEFKTRIRENLHKEKELKNREKKRGEIGETIVNKTTMTLPEILIESEIHKMFGQFKDDVARANVEYETYLKDIKKTEDDLRKEWRETAEKRAKLQLIINQIAEAEKISPASEMVEQQTKHMLEHYKDADENRLRVYVASMMLNTLVFDFLENQGVSKPTKEKVAK